MKKYLHISALLFFLNYVSVAALSIDNSYVLGFDGVYKENSWSPLIIRISNDDRSISGNLVVEINNSSTAFEQKRKYVKPVDLPSDSLKELSFVLPIGHHSRDIRYYFESDNSIIFEKTIPLKQKGIKKNFILGVSPYPDLGFLINHNGLGSRSISYPHIDNLPINSNAYDSVDIISIHREMMDRLTGSQFQAISGWVNQGGILVVWGGKSPSPSKWNYLPSTIEGLKKIGSSNVLKSIDDTVLPEQSILFNIVKTPDENRVLSFENLDLISRHNRGRGFVYFISFDYSGALRNWPGLNRIWTLIFNSTIQEDEFHESMENDFLLENYIDFFDNSGFTYLDRRNVALILFLSASVSFSMMIFIRLRRKSKYVSLFISSLVILLLLLSIFIFLSLYNNHFRTDCFVISSNVVYQREQSEKSLLFKDILIGSSNKTSSDIILLDDSQSILKQDKVEDLTIENSPEIRLKNITLDQWSSRMFHFERPINSILSIHSAATESGITGTIHNNSDFNIHDTFIYFKGQFLKIENIMPEKSISFHINENSVFDHYSNNNALAETAVNIYLKSLENEETVYAGGFISDDVFPLEFTRSSWKKKTLNLLIASSQLNGSYNFE